MSSRRDEILSVARQQFAENGYQATSMRSLAEANGLLAGSLYSHFRSKAWAVEEIIMVFYNKLIPAQLSALEGGGTGAEQLSRMIGAVFRVCQVHHLELTILHYDWRAITSVETLPEVLRSSKQTLELWEQVVTAGIEDGTLRSDSDPSAVMRVITSSIHGLLDSVRYDYPQAKPQNSVQAISFLQQLILGGISVHTPAN